MSVTAHLPDGSTLEFPDGTPPEVISAKVKAMINQPEPATQHGLAGLLGMKSTGGTLDEGMADAVLKPIAGAAALIGSQWRETPTTTAMTRYANEEPSSVAASTGEDITNTAAQMAPLPKGLTQLEKIPALAESPWLRKAIAAVLEGGKGGLTTLATGGSTGDAAMQTAGGAVGGYLGQAAHGFEQSAKTSFARAVGAPKNVVPEIEKVAPTLIRDEGIWGTRRGMAAQVENLATGAEAERAAAASSLDPVDMSPASKALREEAIRRSPQNIADPILTKAEIANIQEILDSPMYQSLSHNPAAQDSIKAQLARMHNLGKGADLDSILAKSEAEWKVLDDPTYARHRMLNERADAIDAHVAAGGGTTPMRDAVTYRQELDNIGNPGPQGIYRTGSLNEQVHQRAAQELNDVLHSPSNPATDRLGKADARSHAILTARDALRDALRGDVSDADRAHFTKYILGRMAVGGVLGAGYGGFSSGGQAGSTLTGVAGGAALAGLISTPLWHSISAQNKLAIADAIRDGKFGAAVRLFQAATRAVDAPSVAPSGLPRAPQE